LQSTPKNQATYLLLQVLAKVKVAKAQTISLAMPMGVVF